MIRRFIADENANVWVGITCIALIAITALTWLLLSTPTLMMIETLQTMTTNPRALQVLNALTDWALGVLLIGEILALLIWWLASAFKREDQTYYGGYTQ